MTIGRNARVQTLRKSLIALLIVVCDNASHPRSAAFIMSTNMLDDMTSTVTLFA